MDTTRDLVLMKRTVRFTTLTGTLLLLLAGLTAAGCNTERSEEPQAGASAGQGAPPGGAEDAVPGKQGPASMGATEDGVSPFNAAGTGSEETASGIPAGDQGAGRSALGTTGGAEGLGRSTPHDYADDS